MATYPELAGRIVAVTGGAMGIGEACAEAFAGQGSSVWILDREADRAAATAERIVEAGGRASFVQCDVADSLQVDNAVSAILSQSGRLDVAVCNAATNLIKTIAETEPDEWRHVIDVNLTGAFLVSRAAYLAMREQAHGSIIFMGSPHAYRSMPEQAAYAAAKGGVSALMRALAVEAAEYGIRVNCVMPGATETPALRAEADRSGLGREHMFELWGAVRPLGRIGDAREVADMVLFLASDSSSYVTGSDFFVDGGLMAAQPGDMAMIPKDHGRRGSNREPEA